LKDSKQKLSPQSRAKLVKFLSALPERLSARLAQAVELDRVRRGTVLPHGEILEALRPSLRRLYERQKQEKNTLQRVLETVPREVRNALPIRQIGGFGAYGAPLDLRASPASNKFRRAERLAQILAKLRGPAVTYGLEHSLAAARTEVSSSIRLFQRGLVRELRAARAGDFAEGYRQPALALGAKVLNDSELLELRRAKPPI
jgi:hypothetical protein